MDIKRKATDGAVVPFKKPRSDIVAYGGQDNAVMQMVFFLKPDPHRLTPVTA